MMTTISTQLGRVKGIEGDGVHAFLGLRYAAPPTGSRRFAPPEPADGWRGVWDATSFPSRAMQAPGPKLIEPTGPPPGDLSEDCLFLNIYTPAPDDNGRPVMVWIHGGGYSIGSANEYDGSVLARQGDVVVVCINYRLGIFGFLDLSRYGAEFAGSASNGFRDMIAALAWVRDNIADYGGDPDNVTIFGESSGGGSVLALLAAPSADGLYHRAIAHSPGGSTTPPVDGTPVLAATLGVDADELLARLQRLSAHELLDAQVRSNTPAAGSIDGTVVTRSPAQAIRERGNAGVPVIAGTTRDEGTFFPAVLQGDSAATTQQTTAMAALLLEGADPTGYLERLRATYPEADEVRLNELVWTDVFRRPSIAVTEAATEAGPGGWLYRFDLPTSALGGRLGATHGSDLPFIFNAFGAPGGALLLLHDPSDPAAVRLASSWSATLVAFARTGEPNGPELPEWPCHSVNDCRCLVLDGESHVEIDLDDVHRKLWDDPRTRREPLERIEFGSGAWVAQLRRILEEGLAGEDLSDVEFSMSEEFTDPPAHLRKAGNETIGWHCRIRHGRVEVHDEPATDVDVLIVGDYDTLLPMARMVVGDELSDADRQQRMHELVASGTLRVGGDSTKMPPAMAKLNLHDRLAVVTA